MFISKFMRTSLFSGKFWTKAMSTHVYQNPKAYSANNNLQYAFAKQLLSKIKIFPTDRVLDVGCGDGRITADELAVSANNGTVVGTDISKSMIEYASKTYTKQSNLRFLRIDASETFFRNQFDLVTSFNCLHWVREQEKAIQAIKMATVENGTIALLLSHKKSTYHYALDKVCSDARWVTFFEKFETPRLFFEADDYKKLLENAGLNVTLLAEEEMTYWHENREQLQAFFSSSMAHVKRIPEDQKNEFLDDVSNEFINMLGIKKGNPIPVSFWCLQVIATKPALELHHVIDVSENDKAKNSFSAKL